MTQVDEVFQQLSHHQDTINTILANQAIHSTMLKNLLADSIDIKAALQHLTKQMADLHRKLDSPPPPLPLSPTPSTLLPASIADFTTSAPALTLVAAVAPPPPASTTAAMSSTIASLPWLKRHTPLPIFDANAPSLHQPPLSIKAPSSPIKTSDSTHQTLKHFSDSHIEFLFGINIGSPMKQQICLDVYFGVMPFAVLCMRQALYLTLPKMQKWADAQDMFVEMYKQKYERKIFIFDPGGIFNLECFFDLEDKVVFKGSVMIRLGLGMLQEVCTLYEE